MTTCPFARFKHALGEPRKGLHRFRVLDTPAVDYVLSLGLAAGLTALFRIPLVLTTIAVLLLAVVAHVLFGVDTPTTAFLGLTCPN
jgi:hypothetical protein